MSLSYRYCRVCGGIVDDEECHRRAHELLAKLLKGERDG